MALLSVTLVAAVCLPALGRSRQPADRIVCANNLRMLGQALLMYQAENSDFMPPREIPRSWPTRLLPYYTNLTLLRCPADGPNPGTAIHDPAYPADSAPRSYGFNGWNDYFQRVVPDWNLGRMMGKSMPASAIKLPAQTIVFGEKETTSIHYYMDLLAWNAGNDLIEFEQARHFRTAQSPQEGGSNYAFADGSVRFLKYGRSLWPTNLWATEDLWRQNIDPGP